MKNERLMSGRAMKEDGRAENRSLRDENRDDETDDERGRQGCSLIAWFP
jgi:hypothetical protein